MATAGLQLLGFLIALLGMAATVAATFMVQWKKQYQGKGHRVYEGLWMSCSGGDRTTCETYESLLKLPMEVQVTRATILLSLLLSALGLMVSTVGMKCTRFMDGNAGSKSTTAMFGGIMFILSGLLTISVTSWYVKVIVQTFHQTHRLLSFEFGKAVLVSLAGGLLTLAGGAFLSCRRCWRAKPSESISSNQLFSINNQKSNYV